MLWPHGRTEQHFWSLVRPVAIQQENIERKTLATARAMTLMQLATPDESNGSQIAVTPAGNSERRVPSQCRGAAP